MTGDEPGPRLVLLRGDEQGWASWTLCRLGLHSWARVSSWIYGTWCLRCDSSLRPVDEADRLAWIKAGNDRKDYCYGHREETG